MSTNSDQFIIALKDRLENDQVYTFIGEVLLHLQPFQNFTEEQNEDEKIQQYMERLTDLPEHIFSFGISIFFECLLSKLTNFQLIFSQ